MHHLPPDAPKARVVPKEVTESEPVQTPESKSVAEPAAPVEVPVEAPVDVPAPVETPAVVEIPAAQVPAVEIVAETIQPIIEPAVEPVVEPAVEPAVEPVVELVVEPVVEHVVELVAEPVAESVEVQIEPVQEQIPTPEVPAEAPLEAPASTFQVPQAASVAPVQESRPSSDLLDNVSLRASAFKLLPDVSRLHHAALQIERLRWRAQVELLHTHAQPLDVDRLLLRISGIEEEIQDIKQHLQSKRREESEK
jgi:hypothetical protein